MKIDLQSVVVVGALLGAAALVLIPRKTAASLPPVQATGAGAAFVNMSLDGAYTRAQVADMLPSARWAGLAGPAAAYVPGYGSFVQ